MEVFTKDVNIVHIKIMAIKNDGNQVKATCDGNARKKYGNLVWKIQVQAACAREWSQHSESDKCTAGCF